jgi:hypothetical protein
MQNRGASLHSFSITGHFLVVFMQRLLCGSGHARAMLELYAWFLFQERKYEPVRLEYKHIKKEDLHFEFLKKNDLPTIFDPEPEKGSVRF